MADVKAASRPVASDGDGPQGMTNVRKEDQEKINRFAKLNARIEDLKDEITNKTSQLKNYEDALSEAELKVLEDEGDKLHLSVGDVMVNLSPEKTQEWLEEEMGLIKKNVSDLQERKATIESEMSELKAYLYATFGDNIHLESGS